MIRVDELVRLTVGFHQTCTIDRPRSGCVTFAKDWSWLMKLEGTDAEVFVLVSYGMAELALSQEMKTRVRLIPVDDPVRMFIEFHNEVNRNARPMPHEFPDVCSIDPTAVIGAEGLRFIKVDARLVRMKHMGNVVIGEDVEIGPLSVVYRGSIDSTVIGAGVKMGAHCVVGHNAVIGENTFLTDMVDVGGSADIGRDCFLGLGSLIRESIRICDNVRLGMGAAVVRDIVEPGTYAGVPARRIGDWDGGW